MFSFFKKKTPADDASAVSKPSEAVPVAFSATSPAPGNSVAAPPPLGATAEAVSPAAATQTESGTAAPSWLSRLGGWVVPKPISEGASAFSSVPPVAPLGVEPVEVPAAPPAPRPEPAEEPAAERSDWLAKLRSGLRKTGTGISQVFIGAQIGDALYEELETALLQADAGINATEYLLDDLKRRVKRAGANDATAVKGLLADAIAELLAPLERSLEVGENSPTVMMVVGVNGAGKTTTIGKLTRHLVDAQQKVMLAAADTFRAAAREQLMVWADRADRPGRSAAGRVEIVSQQGGDPAGVTFDAVVAAKSRGCDVVIADTAGRLTTQAHLMEELKKIRRVIGKAQQGAPHEVLLVIDGNTGQNALAQVHAFDAALGLTGLVVTKLDGTAKGGVLAAIALWARSRPTPIAVYFIGAGEKLEDLQTFDAREFAHALLG
ncbi:MAG: signal recognition particle-docking protein FtsY [Caldimonas sp.]